MLALIRVPLFEQRSQGPHPVRPRRLTAARRDEGLAHGVNMAAGRLINQAVAETLGLDCSTL
jgi:hypothetical protein